MRIVPLDLPGSVVSTLEGGEQGTLAHGGDSSRRTSARSPSSAIRLMIGR